MAAYAAGDPAAGSQKNRTDARQLASCAVLAPAPGARLPTLRLTHNRRRFRSSAIRPTSVSWYAAVPRVAELASTANDSGFGAMPAPTLKVAVPDLRRVRIVKSALVFLQPA